MTPDPASVRASCGAELARLPAALDALLGALDAAAWRARPAAGEWSPVEIVCHLRDEETEDFGARLRVIVEGGARFAPITPEGWARARAYHDADGPAELARLGERRAATLAWLATVPAERLSASVALASGGQLSGLDLLVAWVAHDRLHLAQLAQTLARLWADRWAPFRADYAGPLPYPAPPAP